jgi:hypothetical protein
VDLTAIKHCKTFQGTITIQNVGPAPALRMEGIESITGDLILSGNPGLGSFSAPQLKTVQGAIKIANHTILSKADFPQLTEAASMTLSVLPALESIQFPSGLVKVGSMTIEDTRAPKVDGFKPESIGSFTLNNNNYMKSFDFSSVKQASEIMILGNNRALSFDVCPPLLFSILIFFIGTQSRNAQDSDHPQPGQIDPLCLDHRSIRSFFSRKRI